MDSPVRIALALALGIWLASLMPPGMAPLLYVGIAIFCFTQSQLGRARPAVMAGLLGACLMSMSLGEQREAERGRPELLDDREIDELVGSVVGPTQRLPGRQRVLLETERERISLIIYGEDGDRPEPMLEPGDRIQVAARLRRPIGLRGLGTANRRFQVMAQGASLVASARASEVRIISRDLSMWRSAMALHDWAVAQLEAEEGRDDGRAIVAALATGERSLMSDSLTSAVRAAGLAHLLAVSGMHMAAVVALVYWLVIRLWSSTRYSLLVEPKAVAAGAALGAAIFFTALTGARPSTCRALAVAALVLVGVMLDRRCRPLPALAWAATALLLWRPVLLWDVGFQMSFAATIALALAFSREPETLHFSMPSRARRLIGGLWSIVRASFWASFATAPIALYHFGEVSGIGLVANVVAVPLVTVVLLPAALLGMILSAVFPTLGDVILKLCIEMAEGIAWACYRIADAIPLQTHAPLSGRELLLWGVAGGLLLGWRRPILQRLPVGRWLGLAGCLSLFLWFRIQGPTGLEVVRITFVEIGQGDAAVIELPEGEVWLVDGGGLPFVASGGARDAQKRAEAPARRALLPYLRHRRIDHIDLAVVSHPHPDHYVGLQAVARTMPIAELWSVHEVRARPGPYEAWLEALEAAGTVVRAPPIGNARVVGGAALQVLWPLFSERQPAQPIRPAQGDPILSVNDNSLVVRLQVGGRRVLFTGDIEEEAEELLIAEYGAGLRADVLKVPHHGSRTSSTAGFVGVTRPHIAVISCGRANRFEFPAAEVEARWQEHSGQVFRTDRVGSITVEIGPDGDMRVETAAGF